MVGIETVLANSLVMATQICSAMMGPSPQELSSHVQKGIIAGNSKNRIILTNPDLATKLGEPSDNLCVIWDQPTGAPPDGYRNLDLAMPVCDVIVDHLKSDLPILDFRRSTFPSEVNGQQAGLAFNLTNVTNTDGQPIVLIQGNKNTNVAGEGCGISNSLGKLIMTNSLDANNPQMTVGESDACLAAATILQEVIVTDSLGNQHRAMIDPSSINGIAAIDLGDGRIQLGKGGPKITPSMTSWVLHDVTGEQKMIVVYSGFNGHASITDWATSQLPLIENPSASSTESLTTPNQPNQSTQTEKSIQIAPVDLPTRTVTTDAIYLTITNGNDIAAIKTTDNPGDTVTALQQVAANPGSTYMDLIGVVANLDSQTTNPAEWTRSWNNFWHPNQKIFAEAIQVNGKDLPPILQLIRLSRSADDYLLVTKDSSNKIYVLKISTSDLTKSMEFTDMSLSTMRVDSDGSAMLANEFHARAHRYDMMQEFDITASVTTLPAQWSKPNPSDVELQYMVKHAIDAGDQTVPGFVTDQNGKLAAINIPTGIYGVPGDIVCREGSSSCLQSIRIKLVDIPNGQAKDQFIASLRPYFEVIDPNFTNNKSVPSTFDIIVNINDLAKSQISSHSQIPPYQVSVITPSLPNIKELHATNPVFALQRIRAKQRGLRTKQWA